LMAEVPGGCEPTVCPPDSCFIEGNSCLDSNNDCLCKEGLTMSSSGSCVPSTGYCLERQYYVEDDCSAVSCPAGSCVDPDEDCVDSVEKCLCQGGSMMSDEMECVNGDGALVEQTPECMDSFTMSVSGLCESASAPAPGPAAGDDKWKGGDLNTLVDILYQVSPLYWGGMYYAEELPFRLRW
jgi:hypothetical protein